MLTPLLLFVLADPTPLNSKIEDVTLYGSSAMVHRTSRVNGSGSYVIQGLPTSMDKNNVRVRCAGGDVMSVEVRDRQQATAPSERLEALRAKLKVAGRELQTARDEVRIVEAMQAHLASLANLDAKDFKADVDAKRGDTANWNLTYSFLQSKLMENAQSLRTAQWKAEDAERAYKEIETEIGGLSSRGNINVRDVVIDVEAGGEAVIDVEYMVSGTGWQPYYDLRTTSDLASVELGYRARIQQRTGEDWNDVAISLSTAEPQRGAQGPEPIPEWISLYEPNRSSGLMERAPASAPAEYARKSRDRGLLSDEESKDKEKSVFAVVQSQGLSVQFQLARRETIQSRDQPTTVLVGRAALAVTTERHCTPALDTTVWLRGKAKNTSVWTLLPGEAAVFLGADYLGKARLDAVQPGQEFTLHLGADPMFTVKRTQTEDLSKGPGFLSSRAEKIEAWRIHLENHGSVTQATDGAVDVIVREVLPRSRDERISVELTKSEPKISKDERWKQDLEEKGIRTWVVRVPKNGATDITWQSTITYPKGAELTRE
ncbi:MAG: DUF4139 domain-containing protein [Planctomycetes bacterium]|nr:DUF4139 domain-containing protein [Planctomycetota bacterium]